MKKVLSCGEKNCITCRQCHNALNDKQLVLSLIDTLDDLSETPEHLHFNKLFSKFNFILSVINKNKRNLNFLSIIQEFTLISKEKEKEIISSKDLTTLFNSFLISVKQWFLFEFFNGNYMVNFESFNSDFLTIESLLNPISVECYDGDEIEFF